jgi:hypothetical protein
LIDLGEAFFYFNPHWWLAAEKQIRGQIPLGISLNSAIMHSAQLCAVMLGDSDRSPMGIGFVPFGAAIFWT